ncbi:MAG: TetR/AcrR family transcriptional regulator [Candidatus Saccharimonadales bacterium]
MYDPDKFKAVRTTPSQARGKERVRVILASALELFQQYGLEEVTTNDIAAQAKIPIGSLYRYYPNKDAIMVALTELYVDDLAKIFDDIGKHQMLPHLSWDEVLLLMVDAWVTYSNMNGPFEFLYAEKANPRLHALSRPAWTKFIRSFFAVLKGRCPQATDRECMICFQLCLSAVELGTNANYLEITGPSPHHDAVSAVASYMLRSCNRHVHPK